MFLCFLHISFFSIKCEYLLLHGVLLFKCCGERMDVLISNQKICNRTQNVIGRYLSWRYK